MAYLKEVWCNIMARVRENRELLQVSLVLLPAIAGVFGIIIYVRSASFTSKYPVAPPNDEGNLEAALESASMGNKTIIVTAINKAYTAKNGVLDLFLESLRGGDGTKPLIPHILFAAFDSTGLEQCRARDLHCYKVSTNGVDFSHEKLYMSDDYRKMMWRRTLFITEVLAQGYSFVFTDVDILWFRNPFLQLSEDDDVQFSCDRYRGQPHNTSSNDINAGFFFVYSSEKTIKLFNKLYESKDQWKQLNEQDILQMLIRDPVYTKLGIKFRFVNTLYFSGFCEKSGDMRKVHTMHANCCRTIKAKMIDLKARMDAWKSFNTESKHSNTNPTTGSWPDSKACLESWKQS